MNIFKCLDPFLALDKYEKLWKLESIGDLDPSLDHRTFMNTKLYYCNWAEYHTYVLMCERHLRRMDTTRRTISHYLDTVRYEDPDPPFTKIFADTLEKERKILHLCGHIIFEWMHHESVKLTKSTTKWVYFNDPRGCLKYCYRRKFLRTEHEVVTMIASHLTGMIAERMVLGKVEFNNKDTAWIAVYASKLVSISAIEMTLQGNLRPNSLRITLHHWIKRGFEIAHNFLLLNRKKLMDVYTAIRKDPSNLDKAKFQALLGEQLYNRRPTIIELIEGGVIKGFRTWD